MKKVYLLVFFQLIALNMLFGQSSVSDGDWSTGSVWDSGVTPGLTVNGGTVNVFHYVTVYGAANTLSLAGGAILNVKSGSTLVIEGNLDIGGTSAINVEGNLIVLGNYTSAGSGSVTSTGVVVVGGEFSTSGASDINTSDGQLYLYDDSPTVKDGSLTGVTYTEGDLSNDYPNIFNFVEGSATTPLPVTLLYFKASAQSSSIEINWATAKAWDFSHFEIERSENGKEFYQIGSVDAAEFSNETVEYSFTDHSPAFGASYYRLKAVDIDGAFEYIGIELVNYGAESFSVYPNPSSQGYVTVEWSHAAENVVASLIDNMGRTVRTASINGQTKRVETSGLSAGMYLLIVKSAAGVKQTQVMIR